MERDHGAWRATVLHSTGEAGNWQTAEAEIGSPRVSQNEG
jgi:hypothetical protein